MLDDEVVNRVRRADRRGLAARYVNEVSELTSRISSSDIPRTLEQLGVRFTGAKPAKGERYPVDVLLATNMISVGVDIPRLGLMICSGQPKTTAEYIQATSRVGRDATVRDWSSRSTTGLSRGTCRTTRRSSTITRPTTDRSKPCRLLRSLAAPSTVV